MTSYIRFKSVDEAHCFLGQSIYIIRGGEYQEFTLDSVNLRTDILEINSNEYNFDEVYVSIDENTYDNIITESQRLSKRIKIATQYFFLNNLK